MWGGLCQWHGGHQHHPQAGTVDIVHAAHVQDQHLLALIEMLQHGDLERLRRFRVQPAADLQDHYVALPRLADLHVPETLSHSADRP